MAAAFRAAAIHQAKRVGFTQQALDIAAKETTLRLVVLNNFLQLYPCIFFILFKITCQSSHRQHYDSR